MAGGLPRNYFQRNDESADEGFYDVPRLVTHIDDNAIAAVTQLYREWLPAGGEVLDLMSSWVSHLPPEVEYKRVVGLGMNQEELDANPRLATGLVRNLNVNPTLPFPTASFDAATICVSVQYLTQPVRVFREIGRVLRPAAPLIVTFSNRCFPTKAVAVWRSLDGRGHCDLVTRYFEDAGNWGDVRTLDLCPRHGQNDPLFAVIGYARGLNSD